MLRSALPRTHRASGGIGSPDALIAGAAVWAGIALLNHKTCGVTPYDTSMTDCGYSSQHPFVGAGWAVLIGGSVQAGVVAVLGHVAQVCGQLRTRAAQAAVKQTAAPVPAPPAHEGF